MPTLLSILWMCARRPFSSTASPYPRLFNITGTGAFMPRQSNCHGLPWVPQGVVRSRMASGSQRKSGHVDGQPPVQQPMIGDVVEVAKAPVARRVAFRPVQT